MKRMIWQLPLVAALAIACGTTQKPTQLPSPTSAVIGSAAPSFDLTWMNRDGESQLSDLRGRVVLLEFWRSW